MLKDADALIEMLRRKPFVLAIVQYGSAMRPDAADTDLCVIVSERPRGLESVHFWVESGPVDLNIRTIEEFQSGSVEPAFDDVLREGTVLYEREPGVLQVPCSSRPSPLPLPSPGTLARIRHGHAHYLTKLDYYKDREPLLCDVLLCSATHWLLHAYVSVRGLPYRGEKAALRAMAERDRDLLGDLEALSAGTALEKRIGALRRVTDKVLEPVGGAWHRDEVLYFAASGEDAPDKEEWEEFFESLIGPEQDGPDNN